MNLINMQFLGNFGIIDTLDMLSTLWEEEDFSKYNNNTNPYKIPLSFLKWISSKNHERVMHNLQTRYEDPQKLDTVMTGPWRMAMKDA